MIRALIFFGIFILLLFISSSVLKEKWQKYDSLYRLKENSADYLLAGMSQELYGVNPVYIYEHTGYLGYNLGDEAQNIQFSYFWLVEALKRQSPKAFFLDVGNLFYNESSMTEFWKLKEYSAMPLSLEKINAAMKGTDNRDTRIGALFPLGRYHENWKTLGESDFNVMDRPYLGATIRYDTRGSASPLTINPYREKHEGLREGSLVESISKSNQDYFEKILDLCLKNEIRLIPIKVPTNNWDEERHAKTESFLKQYELPFFDMNREEGLINWETDTIDTGYHMNYWGGCKVSDRLGKYIETLFRDIQVKPDISMDSAAAEKNNDPALNNLIHRYHHENTSQLLSKVITGAEKREQYFRWIAENKDDYVIILTIGDHLSGEAEEISRYFRLLGLSDYTKQHLNDSYIAIIRKGKVTYEKWSKDTALILHEPLLEGSDDPQMEIRSSGKASHVITALKDLATVMIHGDNCTLDQQGLNIVLLDIKSGKLQSSSVLFNENEYIIQSENEKIDTMDRLLSDQSGTYNMMFTASDNIQQEQSEQISVGENVNLQFFETGTYFVQNSEEHYLTVEHAGTKAGTQISWKRKQGDADQLWMLFPDGDGNYQLRSLYNRLWLKADSNGILYLGDTSLENDTGKNALLRRIEP